MDDLRSAYERKVQTLAEMAMDMRRRGLEAETIARAVHAERLAIAKAFKDLTPEPLRTRIRARTIAQYGKSGRALHRLSPRGREELG
ncbi:cell wall-binding protein [Bradyrhizobium sp. KB893862 SZCCT0404]|uniref:cell wall-binding protein n=1 Tax=Bradyrhizobium sp. KB893862 SZCCT0404 TaxID=2807672 RepID=UPI002011AAEB|nr:cell wall-binding protein [Bradyrhizobium sp. KB893862 SZCCT0404]